MVLHHKLILVTFKRNMHVIFTKLRHYLSIIMLSLSLHSTKHIVSALSNIPCNEDRRCFKFIIKISPNRVTLAHMLNLPLMSGSKMIH